MVNAGFGKHAAEAANIGIGAANVLSNTTAAVWDVCRVVAGSGCGGRGFGGVVAIATSDRCAQVDAWGR